MKRTRVERGLYRQTNGNYGVYVVSSGKHRWRTVGPKLSEARRERDLLVAKAHRGELAERCTITFAHLAQTWLSGFEALVESGERSERTLDSYRAFLKCPWGALIRSPCKSEGFAYTAEFVHPARSPS